MHAVNVIGALPLLGSAARCDFVLAADVESPERNKEEDASRREIFLDNLRRKGLYVNNPVREVFEPSSCRHFDGPVENLNCH